MEYKFSTKKIYKSSFLHVALLETGVDLSPVTLDSL